MDAIIRMIAKDAPIKAMAISATNLVQRAVDIHDSFPLASAALGRTLMAAALIGNTLKGDDASVTLRVHGSGQLGTILAVSDSTGNVRGYVQHPQVILPPKAQGKLDVGAGVGVSGTLTVIKDLNMKEPYVGTVPLVSGEIAEDITAYFAESEQIPTACALGVLVDRDYSILTAGGYLIQLLPGADEEVIERIEAGIHALGAVTPALQGGLSPEDVLRTVLHGFELELLETIPIEYRCYCSRERMETALISLGKDELRAILDEQGKAELSCQFCDTIHTFDADQLQSLIDGLD